MIFISDMFIYLSVFLLISLILVLGKKYLNGGICVLKGTLVNKTVVITGKIKVKYFF